MQITAHGLTDKGRARSENQDAFLVDVDHGFFAVADGVGGLSGGADASRRIVELLEENIRRISGSGESFDFANTIIGINQLVTRELNQAYPEKGSGSTLTLGRIIEKQLVIGHVGDSAAYRLRGGELQKLTIDHTMEQELIEQYGEGARRNMPPAYPHTLTRCIGQEGNLVVDQSRVDLVPGDRILLCTDGLSKVVSESEIIERLASDQSPQEICEALIDRANANSGPDNITAITVLLD
ncbi:MAG TPA: protein phosphatase 2C domain-containing protein [Opitutales bacterium]|nr:protein phosphatase 2C domain-containing protein [Opitutales bacterium]